MYALNWLIAKINCKCKVRRNDTVCFTDMADFLKNIHKFRM